MKYFKHLIIFAVSLFFFSCSNTLKKTFEKYSQIRTVYTDNLQKTKKYLDTNIQIYPLPKNLYQLLPNQALLLWDTTINNEFTNLLVKKTDKDYTLYLFLPTNLTITSFFKYLQRRNPELKYVVTDKPKLIKELAPNFIIIPFKVSDTNAYKTIFDRSELIFAFQELPKQWQTLKKLSPTQIQNLKIIFSPYSPSCDFIQFIKELKSQINFEQIHTNNILTLKAITKNKFRYNFLNDSLLNKILIKQIESGQKIIVFLKKQTFSYNNLNINKVKRFFSKQNLYEDEYSLVFYSNYLSDRKFIKTVNDFTKKFRLQKIISNKGYVIKQIIDTSALKVSSFSTLTHKKIKKIKKELDGLPGGLIYFPTNDLTDSTGFNLINSYLKHYTKYNLVNKADLYISPYLYDSILAKKVRKLCDQYKFDIIYTTKVNTVKFYLSGDSLINKTKILWFPYYLSAINKKPEKNFVSKLQNTKLSLFSGKALIVYYKDPLDSLFLPYKKIKQLLDAPLTKKFETSTGIIFYSSFLDTNNIKTFKKIIGNDTNKYIFTNNVPFLRTVLKYPSKKVSWLPYKCILPTCAINTQLQKKLSEIRINIILDSALIIYFRDPTDSIFPDERELKEAFKFLNFVDFKKGFIIKSYEGH